MSATLFTAPTTEPVSVAEVKNHARIDDDEQDGRLASLITAARVLIENETRRALVTQTWDATWHEGWPTKRVNYCSRPRLVLPRPPVQSITYIKYLALDGTLTTLAADQYALAKDDTGEWVIEPAYQVIWPTLRRQMAAIQVRFVAGYGAAGSAVPEPLRQAILLLVQHWNENREAVTAGSVNELPLGVQSLVFPYRVFY